MTDQRPNILILFTDMQRADTVHALGNETIKTPALDRLVREGTAFTNCFSPSPVCVPARCCMHYGWYPQKTGLCHNGRMMDDNGRSYPAVLGAEGYRTQAIGKCHFTPDKHALRGFQSRRVQEECTSNPDDDDYVAWLRDNGLDYYEPHGARGDMYYTPQVSTLPAEAHPTQWIGDRTLEFLRHAGQHQAPWCLFSSFIHPHPPFAPPKPWHKLYRVPDMPLPFLPDNPADLQTWINRKQNRYKYRDRGLDLNLIRLMKAYYYASISFVDFQIGRILDALETAGTLDNTLVLFASDHGEHLGDLGCFGKRSMHDPSARVPLIARFPSRFQPGTRCSTATSLCDVYPTLLGACGIAANALDLDGVDLAWTARHPDAERVVFSQYSEGATGIYMAVTEKWKYVYSTGDQTEWFFDREEDPHETVNLATAPACADPRRRLKTSLLEQLQQTERTEAFVCREEQLEWRPYPRIDEHYLADPDAGLLLQDYPSYATRLPGYTTPKSGCP